MAKYYVDSHFHIWEMDRLWYRWPTPIHRNVHLDEYEKTIAPTKVKYGVFVQVNNNDVPEAEWIYDLMTKNSFLKGCVAGLDPSKPEFESNLDRLKGKIVGIRHLTQYEDNGWICQEIVHKNLKLLAERGLTYDFTLKTHFLKDGLPLAKEIPELKIVVDHIGMPDMRKGLSGMDVWQDEMADLAKCPNVYCKFSAFVSDGPWNWTIEDFRPYAQHVLDVFGPDRIMFGSDWPVCLQWNATYQDVIKLAEDLTQHYSNEDKDKIFRTNTIKFYNLQGCE